MSSLKMRGTLQPPNQPSKRFGFYKKDNRYMFDPKVQQKKSGNDTKPNIRVPRRSQLTKNKHRKVKPNNSTSETLKRTSVA